MANNPIEISIVVPVYSSATTLPLLVSRVNIAMTTANLSYELIFCDDHSPDHTWQVICEAGKNKPQIVAIRLDKNQGQWCATLAGMATASGRYIVTMDDDLEYDPEDIVLLYNKITTSDYSLVLGIATDKYPLQGKSLRLAHMRNKLINFLWSKPPSDSFKILKRMVIFRGKYFLPKEPLDVFLTSELERRFWGYVSVGFSKRYIGQSNYPLRKKIALFFLYSSFFIQYPKRKLIAALSLLGIDIIAAYLLFAHHYSYYLILISGLFLTVLLLASLYYLLAICSRPPYPLYAIEAWSNAKP